MFLKFTLSEFVKKLHHLTFYSAMIKNITKNNKIKGQYFIRETSEKYAT